ncbi:MAG: hypothetical protein AB1449_15280 [Chloroflexota bacterium]
MTSAPGDRFHLLIYRQAVRRYRGPGLLLSLTLLGLWYPVSLDLLTWPRPPADAWLLAGGLVSLAFTLLAWLGPRWAYAQARPDHLRLQTPIYRMKVSYRRILGTRPIDVGKMFPLASLPRSQQHLIAPYHGRTALGVDLRGLPLSPFVLRLFFSRFLFATDHIGLILVVDDWMALGRQLVSRIDSWRAANQPRGRGPGIGAAAILEEE